MFTRPGLFHFSIFSICQVSELIAILGGPHRTSTPAPAIRSAADAVAARGTTVVPLAPRLTGRARRAWRLERGADVVRLFLINP